MRSPRRTGIDSQQMVMNRADPLLTSNSRSASEICNQWSKTYRFVASLEMFFMSHHELLLQLQPFWPKNHQNPKVDVSADPGLFVLAMRGAPAR